MNLTQLQERLRLELLRRIQRGTLTNTLLARQTGIGRSHLSNFLRGHRTLSLQAMDRILDAQHLAALDLLQNFHPPGRQQDDLQEIPIVSPDSALFDPQIRPAAVLGKIRWLQAALQPARAGPSGTARHHWDRFVALRVPATEAMPMDPVLLPNALVVIDRHYLSLAPCHPGRPNLYAVRERAHLRFRYVEAQMGHLILRPHKLAFPVELLAPDPGRSFTELLAGRIVHVQNDS